MTTTDLKISRVSELHLLRHSRKYDRISLQLSFLSQRTNKRWSEKLNKAYHESGNGLAKYFTISSFILGILFFSYKLILGEPMLISHLIYFLLSLVIMAGIGKMIGRSIANLKLENIIVKIQAQANNQRLMTKN